MKYIITTEYQIGDKKYISDGASEDFNLICDITDQHIMVDISPIHPMHHFTINITLELHHSFDLFFASSLLSSGLAREYTRTERMHLKNSSQHYQHKIGQFVSYTMCYYRNNLSPDITLFGSIDEDISYTNFVADMPKQTLTISRSFDGITLNTKQNIVNILVSKGEYNHTLNKYLGVLADKYQQSALHHKIPLYYSTRANHGNIIDEQSILSDAKYILDHNIPYQGILIEDGYALNNTDWLYQDKRLFPSGIKGLVKKLHDMGLQVGLWICPTLASPQSKIATLHPDWLVKQHNKSVTASKFWGGVNALDITLPPVKQYISKLMDNIYNDFDCDFVKADCIYSACRYPINNHTTAMLCNTTAKLVYKANQSANKGLILSGVPIYNGLFVDMLSICASYNGKTIDRLREYLELDRNSSRYVASSYIFKYFLHDIVPLDYIDLPKEYIDNIISTSQGEIDICATYQRYILDKKISF